MDSYTVSTTPHWKSSDRPHTEARRKWAKKHERQYQPRWDAVLFSDESKFNVSFGDGRVRIWRRDGQRLPNKCVLPVNRFGGGSVMVWAGISTHHRTDLVVVDNRLTSQAYVDSILRDVVPTFRAHRAFGVFQQDNARPQNACVMCVVMIQLLLIENSRIFERV